MARKDFAYIIIPCEDDDELSFMWQNSFAPTAQHNTPTSSCGALSPHDPASAGQYSSRSAAVPRLELGSRPSSAASLRPSPSPSPTSKCATAHPAYGCVSSSRRDLEGPHARPRGAGPSPQPRSFTRERTPQYERPFPMAATAPGCPCARARPPPAPWPSQRHLTRASPWLRRAPPLPTLLPPPPPPPPLRQPPPPLPLPQPPPPPQPAGAPPLPP